MRRRLTDPHLDRRLANGIASLTPHGDMISFHDKRRFLMFEDFADEQGERAFGSFIFIALMLEHLDAVEHFSEFGRLIGDVEAQLAGLHHDVAAAGEVADEDMTRVADQRRIDVLVAANHFLHGVDVSAAFV